jgi:hypothetical protein
VKFINIKKFKGQQDHVVENLLLIMVCGALFLIFFFPGLA